MISYRIAVDNAHAHLFRVSVGVPVPAARQRFSLPVWIPGSYLIREFARHLSGVSVSQGGRPVPLVQLDKATWQADCAGPETLTIDYRVYAFDSSVRAAFLDARRGFFNGTGVFVRVEGREAEPHRLAVHDLPDGWRIATALPALRVDGDGARGVYEVADYDELVDHPVELGSFWRGTFDAHGVAHEFVVAGALPDFDGERLLADTRRICETAIAFWHRVADDSDGGGGDDRIAQPPFSRYVFLLNVVEDGYGGLEHRASTALIAARRDLPRLPAPPAGSTPLGEPAGMQPRPPGAEADPGDGYVTLLGLISHEYFHTWNVKRLKPREFERYDYACENYTELLWFFEGFTSYYDDLLLLRAGLIDEARYLKLLGKTASSVLATPGRGVQSVAQASFDAWVKYYRADENTPNATVSYYAKGAGVALALDLTLRGGAGAAGAAGAASAGGAGGAGAAAGVGEVAEAGGAGGAGGAVGAFGAGRSIGAGMRAEGLGAADDGRPGAAAGKALPTAAPSLDRVMRLLWRRSGAAAAGAGGLPGADVNSDAPGGGARRGSAGNDAPATGADAGTLASAVDPAGGTAGGGPIGEADVLAALHDVAGRSLADLLANWVHGTADLPLAELLAGFGVQWLAQPPTTAQRLGLRVAESALTGVKATHVLRGGAAEAAGVAAGDELLAVGDWRLRRLDDVLRLLTPGQAAPLLVSRDQRLLRLPLVLPAGGSADAGAVTLAAEAKPAAAALARRKAWFAG